MLTGAMIMIWMTWITFKYSYIYNDKDTISLIAFHDMICTTCCVENQYISIENTNKSRKPLLDENRNINQSTFIFYIMSKEDIMN